MIKRMLLVRLVGLQLSLLRGDLQQTIARLRYRHKKKKGNSATRTEARATELMALLTVYYGQNLSAVDLNVKGYTALSRLSHDMFEQFGVILFGFLGR